MNNNLDMAASASAGSSVCEFCREDYKCTACVVFEDIARNPPSTPFDKRLFMFSSQPTMINYIEENWKRLLNGEIEIRDKHHIDDLMSTEYALPELIVAAREARKASNSCEMTSKMIKIVRQIYDQWNLVKYFFDKPCDDLKPFGPGLCYYVYDTEMKTYPVYYEIIRRFGIRIPTSWKTTAYVRTAVHVECSICFEELVGHVVTKCAQCKNDFHLGCVETVDICPLCRHVAV